jgi:hypothetical protein
MVAEHVAMLAMLVVAHARPPSFSVTPESRSRNFQQFEWKDFWFGNQNQARFPLSKKTTTWQAD